MLLPIIMSGGAGSRLWPASREAMPKPFMRIGANRHDGHNPSLLQSTAARALACSQAVSRSSHLALVTNREHYFLSKDELRAAHPTAHYVLEPQGRNTAPAVLMAALWAQARHGNPTLLLLAADHLIAKQTEFIAATQAAYAAAQTGALVLFGIKPTAPETGYGYIETTPSHQTILGVKRFVEKPDAATAAQYLVNGHYVWNSGMFCFTVEAILAAFEKTAPELLKASRAVWQKSQHDNSDKTELAAEFAQLENISIDYAVMEHAVAQGLNVKVVPSDIGWSDIGSWSAVAETHTADQHGNSGCETAVHINSNNTHVQSSEVHKRLVATVGVDNLVIVDTPDALLVAHKAHSQDVKKVVDALKLAGNEIYKLHTTVARPWGTYTILEEGLGFKIKRIVVNPGASLSLQLHHKRSEHWVVVSGTAHVTVDDDVLPIAPNESRYIPVGAKHRLENKGSEPCVMIEVQCGAYLGEDDIVRFSDNYGRVVA